MDLETVKGYIRVDFDDDNILIQTLIDAAIENVEASTGVKFNINSALYRLVILKIIAVNYNNRDGIIDKKSLVLPRFINSDLFKIKYSKEKIDG